MDNLDFLDPPEGGNAETQPVETSPEPQAEPTPAEPQATEPTEPQEPSAEPTEGRQPRGPDGKFAKKDEPVMVPLQALHETRDEVKALKAQLAALTEPQQQQVAQVPDIFENPEGYQAHVQGLLINERLNLSEAMVRQSVGDDVVNGAQEWGKQMFAANPTLAQQFFSQPNPYGFLVREYQRQQTMAQIGDDPEQIKAFLAWKAAQGQMQQGEQPVPQPSPTPPRSIASATSAGGMQNIATGPTVAFDEIFQGR